MNRTIAAISTSLQSAAIGVIRMTGGDTLKISEKILFRKHTPISSDYIQSNSRKAIYCELGNPKKIDKIIYIYYSAPYSYTGEDMAEFSLHGNPILLREALELLFKNGAYPAAHGEFTKRAYLNQKIDLTEAEAVSQIIEARSMFELELAQKNSFGEIHRLCSKLRSDLLNLKAECEAEIDFSEEDLTFENISERIRRIQNLIELCSETIENSSRADTLRERSKLVIYGEPNTGKSTLMNLILGKDRAIVSEIAGTTRDYLSEDFYLSGIPVRLVDTAGIRNTSDNIEKLGIEKSKTEFHSANLKIVVLDASRLSESSDFLNSHMEYLNSSVIVINKIDTISDFQKKEEIISFLRRNKIDFFEISCKAKVGLREFIDYLKSHLNEKVSSKNLILLEDRNKFNFMNILKSLNNVLQLINTNTPAEIYVKEIDMALESVGMINGRVDTEEVLGRIFSKFCIGK